MTDFSTADLHDDQPDAVRILDLQLRCFGARACFHGPVETLRAVDHAAVRDTVAEPGEGRVLVVDGGSRLTIGLLGDRIAGKAAANGWAGVVILGAIRDSRAVDAIDIGVRALGTTARRSLAEQPGERGIALDIGGVRCVPGDWLYADRDAVLISERPLTIA